MFKNFAISSKLYDILKWVALILLPATSTLYAALSGFWNWPYPKEICGTISAISVFLGAILQLSSDNYWKGMK